MDAAVDPALFVNYIPLNALRPESQQNLARKSTLAEAKGGEYLFRVGDVAEAALFLVAGEVQLEDASGKALAVVRAGEPASFHRLAHQSPRKVSARCLRETRYLAVDASLLDVMLTWDQSGRFEVAELTGASADEGDWMTKLLQMRVFQMVPPSNLQAMFMRMQEMKVDPGQVVVRQGEPGDFFYVIMEGRCMVTREAPNQKPMRLAELDSGSCFGEESLIADAERNATVTMLTRGRLMRLSKQDFRTLLNEPIARKIGFDEAQKLVQSGKALWLDVRLPSEYQRNPLPGSINLPLYMLRMRVSQLQPGQTYIAVCDTGRRSSVAVFVLSEKGFEAYSLDKGLPTKA
ncbi:MAG TPA: cyclic nucleotide-binding domain-containing protein [Nevskia sp.]|jgi:CRP-like cAMP-binding protein|nr:cyclic nucleotide-binding domain-containing protein [Nevskia sp.]